MRPTSHPGTGARAAGLLLLLALLAGCGQDPVEEYCAEVDARREPLSQVTAEGGPTALLDALPTFEALREASPDDLRDEWDVVVTRLGALGDALRDAGVDPGAYDRADPPAGLDASERTAIEAAARQLATPEMVRALGAVQQQARDVCGTSLTL